MSLTALFIWVILSIVVIVLSFYVIHTQYARKDNPRQSLLYMVIALIHMVIVVILLFVKVIPAAMELVGI